MVGTRRAGAPDRHFGHTDLSIEGNVARNATRQLCNMDKQKRRSKRITDPEVYKMRVDAPCKRYGSRYYRVCDYNFRPGHPLGMRTIGIHCRGPPGAGASRAIQRDKARRGATVQRRRIRSAEKVRTRRSASGHRRSLASRAVKEFPGFYAGQLRKAATAKPSVRKKARRNRELAALGAVATRKSRRLSSRR